MSGKRIHEMFFALPDILNHYYPVLIAQWDLRGSNGASVASGTYLAVLSVKEKGSNAKRYTVKIDIKKH